MKKKKKKKKKKRSRFVNYALKFYFDETSLYFIIDGY